MLHITRPTVQHSYENHHLAANRWKYFSMRSDDIVVSTSYKAGTTWMQTIVANLIFHQDGLPAPINALSPWLDMRIAPDRERWARRLVDSRSNRPMLPPPHPSSCQVISP